MANMNMTTAIAIGFMNGKNSLIDVLQSTVDFLNRKLTRNELNQIVRAYRKYMAEFQLKHDESSQKWSTSDVVNLISTR